MPTLLRIDSARTLFLRQILPVVAVLLTLMVMAAPAVAQNVPRAFAGIAVDAKTGQVLYQDKANDLRYPASLTKVMTLYILFQELEAGRLQLNSPLSVSAHAAAAVPTKLYVQRGSTITVENAIKALVTLSANDVARVVGENISGTESQFAVRMTQTARALGMSRTTYKNASGLPDSGQVTTAADQAILARAVYMHFPSYYEYFQTRSFTYGSRTYGNHNALLGQNGVDGIKTGYINASGYNLMTAARSNNRHIVVVALGFNTGAARNARVAELVRTYLPQARQGDYWREAMIPRPSLMGNGIAVASAGVAVPLNGLPPTRPVSLFPVITAEEAAIRTAAVSPQQTAPAPAAEPAPASNEPENIPFQVVSADDIPSRPGESALDQATYVATGTMPTNPENDPIGAWIAETLKLAEPDVGTLQPGQVLVPPAPIARPDALTTQSSANVSGGGWIVQVGAANSEDGANQMLSQASQTHGELTDLRGYVEPFQRDGVTYYRARFAGFADRAAARTTCDALSQSSINCLTVQG